MIELRMVKMQSSEYSDYTAYLKLDYCIAVSYTHLRAHETEADLVCRLLLEKKKGIRVLSLIHI